MDSFLIDYLKSGKAWVLVGSGPSIEKGYPTWKQLATHALETVRTEGSHENIKEIESAVKRSDFPKVFERSGEILGGPRLRQCLQDILKESRVGNSIYELIVKWPVPVYLTTNFDDEIKDHLVKIGESYITYQNSEDHLSYLVPDFKGAIVKLHGDLRSDSGLILTTKQYNAISKEASWQYWRTKMTSIFQMNRLVVIGHSLTDQNIRHVLEAAKRGSGVQQPICWIAPDVSPDVATEFLEKYRIRIIPYNNKDGGHKNLYRLIESISDFIPSRTVIHISEQIDKVCRSPLGNTAAAPGFFIFSKLSMENNFEQKRIDIMIAAIQSILPKLKAMGEFTLDNVLQLLGWPVDYKIDATFKEVICEKCLEDNLLILKGDKFEVRDHAETVSNENRKHFEHMRERFKGSLTLRLRRDFPALLPADISLLASDIESSLIGYFKESGLSLATTLFFSGKPKRTSPIPSSIVKFITESSARYNDLLKRQAFCKVAIDAFVRAESAERDYLGRVSQGFFAFHQLGVFGDAAIERLREVQNTVWLVDSSVQIPLLALAAPTNEVFSQSISRLNDIGLRLFTTERLFDEAYHHLLFAVNVIKNGGPSSPSVIAAATGQAPFRKSNQFLEGFIRWQEVGNPCDWHDYMYSIFENRNPGEADVKNAIRNKGIEVIPLKDWPGFSQTDYPIVDEYTKKIATIIENNMITVTQDLDQMADPYKKARPEAEAFLVVKNEKKGNYYILSKQGTNSPSWFISSTSILNLIEPGLRITWQPEAFLRFASTIAPASDEKSSDQAFEILLWGIAQSGLNIIDESIIERVFGGIIEQARLNVTQQQKLYQETIQNKYCESPEEIMGRIRPTYRPLAAVQIANEMAQNEADRRIIAENLAAKESQRAKRAEEQLKKVEAFRKKMESKSQKGKRKARKQKAKSDKNKRG